MTISLIKKPITPNLNVPTTRNRAGRGAWSGYITTDLENIAGTLRILDATHNWKVQAISFGRPAKDGRPAVPTFIELNAGSRSQYQYRYFIPHVADAKRLFDGSPKVLAFLNTPKGGL